MSRARITLEPAFILNARPYSDSSLLLEAFTRARGRIGLVARGARGPRARLRGLLQPLQPLLLSWTESGELGTLTGAEIAGPAIALTGEQVFMAWYLNELLMRLLQRHDAHESVFDSYAAALPLLASDQAAAALRIFEKRLLADIGYGLELPDAIEPDLLYDYDAERGPLPSRDPRAYRGQSLIALRDEDLADERALADARKLLRLALKRQLGDRELETPRLLRQMRNVL